MQMLLYTHPLNDAREARGALPVNAIWFSGTGALAAPRHQPLPLTVAPTLREAALQDDWAGWASAWQALDASEITALLDTHRRGQPVQLTLCGERNAQSWHSQPPSLKQKIRLLFGSEPIHSKLKQL